MDVRALLSDCEHLEEAVSLFCCPAVRRTSMVPSPRFSAPAKGCDRMSQVEQQDRDSDGSAARVKVRNVGTVRHRVLDVNGILRGTHIRRNRADGTKKMSWRMSLTFSLMPETGATSS